MNYFIYVNSTHEMCSSYLHSALFTCLLAYLLAAYIISFIPREYFLWLYVQPRTSWHIIIIVYILSFFLNILIFCGNDWVISCSRYVQLFILMRFSFFECYSFLNTHSRWRFNILNVVESIRARNSTKFPFFPLFLFCESWTLNPVRKKDSSKLCEDWW